MAPTSMTLSDLQGHLLFEAFLNSIFLEIYLVLNAICLHMNRMRMWLVILTVISEVTGFSLLHAVTYILRVEMVQDKSRC